MSFRKRPLQIYVRELDIELFERDLEGTPRHVAKLPCGCTTSTNRYEKHPRSGWPVAEVNPDCELHNNNNNNKEKVHGE